MNNRLALDADVINPVTWYYPIGPTRKKQDDVIGPDIEVLLVEDMSNDK
jgi:hypothetical protein